MACTNGECATYTLLSDIAGDLVVRFLSNLAAASEAFIAFVGVAASGVVTAIAVEATSGAEPLGLVG